MATDAQRHAEHVKAAAEAPEHAPNTRVAKSWNRCLMELGLDPLSDHPPPMVASDELERRQEANGTLLAAARVELANLLRHVGGSGHAIVLSDAEGVILNYSGDKEFNDRARSLGLRLGAVWAERNVGTNALGTCLADAEPVVIRSEEHFLASLRGLTGTGVPLFSPRGHLLGGLHAFGSPERGQEHTLALLRMTAEAIENRYLFAGLSGDQRVVRFHNRPEFVTAPGEGLLVLDAAGGIAGASPSACFHLGYPAVGDLLSHTLAELFNIPPEELPDSNDQTSPRAVYDTRDGRRFYASVFSPRTTGDERVPPAGATRGRAARSERAETSSPLFTLEDLELGDQRMAENIRCARRILDHDLPILIYGETGTGKEMFSKALHHASARAGRNYVAVNCASIPEQLIESELFGYKAGAFTGASREGNRGKIVQADGGTLFLDEIGDMPLPLQGRLLRVLEEREVLPLGSNTPVKVDIRLVSATNRHLPTLIEQGLFREDLYYRLEGVSITLPPLRERQDKRALIRRLMEVENGSEPVAIENQAMDTLVEYHWPGNIRQLCNVLRILLALRDGDVIRQQDLPAEIRLGQGRRPTAETLHSPPVETPPQPPEQPEANPLQTAEREVLIAALERYYWNITNIARRFNVSRNTIYRKMKAHNIRPPRGR